MADIAGDAEIKTVASGVKRIYVVMDQIEADNIINKSADEINAFWKSNGYKNAPYKANSFVKEFETTKPTYFVRVYDGIHSRKEGSWLIRAEDILGLTPQQIKEKYALEYIPKYICDVEIEPGVKMHGGISGKISEWGKGGGLQFDLNNNRTVGRLYNERPISY